MMEFYGFRLQKKGEQQRLKCRHKIINVAVGAALA